MTCPNKQICENHEAEGFCLLYSCACAMYTAYGGDGWEPNYGPNYKSDWLKMQWPKNKEELIEWSKDHGRTYHFRH